MEYTDSLLPKCTSRIRMLVDRSGAVSGGA